MGNDKSPGDSLDLFAKKKNESDSIVRGLLSNSIQYSHEKGTGNMRNFIEILFEFLSQVIQHPV